MKFRWLADIVGLTCALTGTVAPPALAQSGTGAARTAPADGDSRPRAPTAPRLRGESFVYARYSSAGGAALYGAQRVARGTLFAGILGNTRTGSRTFVAGAGTRVRVARSAGVALFAAAASGPDHAQARLYALPRLLAGPLVVSASAVTVRSLSGKPLHRASVDPLLLSVRLSRSLQVGVAVTAEWTRGNASRYGFGPATQIRTGLGTFSVDAISRRRAQTEMRVSFSAAR